jgi:hypothetical protein
LGPITYADSKENHCPRTTSGTRSVTTTSVKVIKPPPPTPWMVLPTKMTVKLFARAAMRDPAANRTMTTYKTYKSVSVPRALYCTDTVR